MKTLLWVLFGDEGFVWRKFLVALLTVLGIVFGLWVMDFTRADMVHRQEIRRSR